MRIIGGKWRSRRIAFPDLAGTRPMPDRIRESIFDVLGSRFQRPGALPPVQVVDLFAGSGGMGLEAVSRGAAACDFVERDGRALAVLRKNLEHLGADAGCRVIRANAWTVCLTTPRPRAGFALVFVDPPYADGRDTTRTGKVGRLLADLHRAGWANEQTIIVLHHEARVVLEADDQAWWRVCDHRVYGSAGVTFVTGRDSAQGVQSDRSRIGDGTCNE